MIPTVFFPCNFLFIAFVLHTNLPFSVSFFFSLATLALRVLPILPECAELCRRSALFRNSKLTGPPKSLHPQKSPYLKFVWSFPPHPPPTPPKISTLFTNFFGSPSSKSQRFFPSSRSSPENVNYSSRPGIFPPPPPLLSLTS